jgi:hypothetical protein
MMEYWNFGLEGFGSIIPVFHHSTTPFSNMLEQSGERNEADEPFSAACQNV